MCLARDRDGRNPLHVAAIKGHVDVLKELVRTRPHAARVTVEYSGVTILHLCVNHNQLEALKLLVETLGSDEFVNSKDDDGNTILHLAVVDKQIQTINFLLTCSTIQVNATNANGFTAADVLAQSRRDVKDKNIRESLKRAGASGAEANRSSVSNTSLSWDTDYRISSPHPLEEVWDKYLKKQDNWLEKTRNTLMVVASLIATMAFQGGVNPPGGVLQDDSQGVAEYFIICNTTGFVASLSIILLLISGLPIRRRVFIWILMVIMWVAVTAMALTYLFSIYIVSEVVSILIIIFTWIGMMAFLLVAHAIRLLLKIIRKSKKSASKKRDGDERRGRGLTMLNHDAVVVV